MKTLITIIVVLVLWSAWGYFSSRVEQAEYTVIKKADGYEIREYPKHIVAQTTVTGTRSEALNEGFRIVAGYIFGGNIKKEGIAMTAPVVAKKSENIAMTAPVVASTEGSSQVISFGMPKSYTLETLPTPTDLRVKLVEVPTEKFAVLKFSWFRTDARLKRMEERLIADLKRDNIDTIGQPAYAGYNAPGTPPWMSRNEVLIKIK